MNYQEIVDASKAYADRQDIEISDNIDTFILLAEARINRVLKTREQSHRIYTPVVADQVYYSLPPDYSGIRDIQYNTDLPHNDHCTKPMSYLSPEQFNAREDSAYGGRLYYTIIANQLQFFPSQEEGSFEIVYYRKVPNLNATDDTNWVSDTHPDIYLSGVIAEIELFVKNYEVAVGWDKRMSRAISELDNSDIQERWGGTSLTTKLGR